MAEKLSGKSNSSGVTTIPALIFHIHWRGKGEALTAFPARRDIRRPPPDFCALTFFISLAQDGCIQKSVSALCTPYEHVCMCGKRTERHREALGVSTVSDFLFRPQQPCSVCLARLRVGGYGCFAWRLSALFGSSAPWERLMGFFNRRLTFGPQNEKKKVCVLIEHFTMSKPWPSWRQISLSILLYCIESQGAKLNQFWTATSLYCCQTPRDSIFCVFCLF